MKKKIGNNLSLKILSLAIAILVWLLVVNINNPISTKSFIVSDVELLNEAYIDADGKMCMQDEEQVPHPCDDQSSEKDPGQDLTQ